MITNGLWYPDDLHEDDENSMSGNEENRSVGRPSKYNDTMITTALQLMGEGASITEVAADIGVSKDTIYDWINPDSERYIVEFSDAIKKGKELSQAWWEYQGRKNLANPKFSSTLWFMNVKNRFKEDWRDRHEVDHTSDGKSIAFTLNIKPDAE